MEVKTAKQKAQEMAYKSISESIDFSIDFYAKEIGKELISGNTHMVEHCEEMYKAYKQLSDALKHFKFV